MYCIFNADFANEETKAQESDGPKVANERQKDVNLIPKSSPPDSH